MDKVRTNVLSILALCLILAATGLAHAGEVQIPDGDTDALLAALAAAEPGGEATVIDLAAGGRYSLPETQVVIAGNVVLRGNGATVTATVKLGHAFDYTHTELQIVTGGSLRIVNLAFDGQFVSGGWFLNSGNLNLENVSFAGEFIPTFPVFLGFGQLELYGSLVKSEGGSPVLTLRNVTMDMFMGAGFGFDQYARMVQVESGTATLDHVSIRFRHDYQGVPFGLVDLEVDADGSASPQVTVSNSALMVHVSGPSWVYLAGQACTGHGVQSLGGNIAGDPENLCGFELVAEDGVFGGYGDHGGLVPTMALPSDSPAVDFGVDAHCLPTDARGVARTVPCDSGAYELVQAAIPLDARAAGYWDQPGTQDFLAVSFPTPDLALVVWSTFDANGDSTTVYGIGKFVDANTIRVAEAAVDVPAAGSSEPQPELWGELEFELVSCGAARLRFQTAQPNFASGERDLRRLSVLDGVACEDAGTFESAGEGPVDARVAGYWDQPGTQDFLAVSFPTPDLAMLVWSTFDASGDSTTIYGVGEFIDADTIRVDAAAIDKLTSGASSPRPVFWGELEFDLVSCDAAQLRYQTEQSGFTSGERDLRRLSVLDGVRCKD